MTITVTRNYSVYPIDRFIGLISESTKLLTDLGIVNSLDPGIPVNPMTTFKNKTLHDELAADLALISVVAAAITDVNQMLSDYESNIDYGPPIIRSNVTYSYQMDQTIASVTNNTYKIGKIPKTMDTAIVIHLKRESEIRVNRNYDPPSWNNAFTDGFFSGYIPSEDDSYIDSIMNDYEAVPVFRIAGSMSLCYDERELGFYLSENLTNIATTQAEQKIFFIGKLNP